jgi:cell wall-associated NlpC family hydrolase
MRKALALCCIILAISGCASRPPERAPTIAEAAREVVLMALALIETGYRFGGKNPEAGLDCSGMVSYVFGKAGGLKVTGSAADIAKRGRPIERARLSPGDLVFFNTTGKPYSHVGIYLGDGRFVHAPSSRGQVRTERIESDYFGPRFHEARRYFD